MTDKEYEFLINPDEAVFLAARAPFSSMANTAEAIGEKAKQDYQKAHRNINKKTLQLLVLHAIFNAGRVYGIREERSKRNRRTSLVEDCDKV